MIAGLNLLYMLPGIVGGTETYAAGLMHGLSLVETEDRFVVYVNLESAEWPLPPGPRFQRVVCPVRAASRAARYWHEQVHLPARAARDGVEVLHSLGYVAPLRVRCPSVLTVHDVHQHAYGGPAGWPRRLVLDGFVRRSLRRAAAVIADSHFSRGEIARAYRVPVESIDVVQLAPKPRTSEPAVPHPAVPHAGAAAARSGTPYLMAFAGVQPNKNLPRLLEAYRQARRGQDAVPDLVLIGRLPPGWRPDGVPGLTVTGYLPDAQVAEVFGGARALLFPSIYEGFGLPVLEAMAAGVPVACSRVTALPEVAGDAALYFDPLDVGDMANKIVRIASDEGLRAELRAKGRAQADRFGWDRAARETLAIYRRVVGSAVS